MRWLMKKIAPASPGYAKIIDEINKPSSYNRLKNIAKTELDSLGGQTMTVLKMLKRL